MSVTVRLENAKRQVLRSPPNPPVGPGLSGVLPPVGDPDFPYLGLIDPYEDTYFTPLQMRAVLAEIRALQRLTTPESDSLAELESLAEECAGGIGVYLVFIGD